MLCFTAQNPIVYQGNPINNVFCHLKLQQVKIIVFIFRYMDHNVYKPSRMYYLFDIQTVTQGIMLVFYDTCSYTEKKTSMSFTFNMLLVIAIYQEVFTEKVRIITIYYTVIMHITNSGHVLILLMFLRSLSASMLIKNISR